MKKNLHENQIIQTDLFKVVPQELIYTILSVSNLQALKCYMLLDADSYKKTVIFLEKHSHKARFNRELKRYVKKKALEQNIFDQSNITIKLNIGHILFKKKAEEILYDYVRSPVCIAQEILRLLSNKNVENFTKYSDNQNNDLNASLDKFLHFNDLKKATCSVDQIGIFPRLPGFNLYPMFIISTIKYNKNKNSITTLALKDMKVDDDLGMLEDNFPPLISSDLKNFTLVMDNSATDILEILKNKQLLEKIGNLYVGGKNFNFKTTDLFTDYPLINPTSLTLNNMSGIPYLSKLTNLKSLTLKNNNVDADHVNIRLPENLKSISLENCKITNPIKLQRDMREKNRKIEINIFSPHPLIKPVKSLK